MKYLIILVLLFSGCTSRPDYRQDVPKSVDKASTMNGYDVEILTYDGCQYISTGWGESRTLTHKGNCNNPIHQYNK